LKLNGTHQLLVYTDDVIILGRSVHTIENTEALVVASREIGLKVSGDKTKHIAMSRDQKAESIHNTTYNHCYSYFERVQQLKYLGTTLTKQNYIQKEIKSGDEGNTWA